MSRIAVLVLLIMIGSALAGCLGTEKVEPEDTDGNIDLEAEEPDDNETTPPPAPENETVNAPPTATLTADNESGQAPLNVTFTLAADDADGDTLTWTLDADGDGETDAEGDTVPGTYTHTFDAAGNYTATATVTDGTDSIETTLDITVEEVPEPTATVPEDIVFSNTILVGAWNPSGSGEGAYVQFPAGNHMYNFTANRTAVSTMTVTIEWGTTGVDVDIYLTAPDGTAAGSSASIGADPEDPIVVDDPALLQQAGDWTAHARVAAGASVDYTVTISFT